MSSIIQTPTKAVAYQIDIGAGGDVAKTPDAIQRKIDAQKKLPNKEDLTAKLDLALERRKTITDSKIQKAKEEIIKAKHILTRVKEDNQKQNAALKEKLEEKLDIAAAAKQEIEKSMIAKIEKHMQAVNERKEAAAQECLSPGGTDLSEKLMAAEDRRKAITDEKKEKLIQHLKTVEERKENICHSPSSNRDIANKLAKAEQRRQLKIEEQQEKLKAYDLRAALVRERRASGVQPCMDDAKE